MHRALRRPLLDVRIEERVDVEGAVAAFEAGRPDGGRFDCAIVDYRLPDGDAFDVLGRFTGARPPTPIIVLTGLENEELGIRLLAAGAQDYLVKSEVTGDTLSRAIRYAIERHRIQSALDEANARLETLSLQDPLTSLLNRRGIERALENELARSERHLEPLIALLVDCDDFKNINENYGLSVGDQVLVWVARCLGRAARESDYVGRIGGDEFLVLLPETRSADAVAVAERVCREVRESPFELAAGALPLTVSVGAAPVRRSGSAVPEVVAATHMALRRVKALGKGQVVWADPRSASGNPEDIHELARKLRTGDGLAVVGQPVFDVLSGQPIGVELLSRGPRGFERPEEFFAAARELDILCEVDLRCLDNCLAAADSLPPGQRIHVNVFPFTLLATPTEELLRRFDQVSGRELYLDLSDRWILGDPMQLRRPLQAIEAAGVRIALDHVGFGRSSLEALLMLGPHCVKTSPRLAAGLAGDAGKRRLVKRLLACVQSVGAELVVLGIETAEDYKVARDLGIQRVQGAQVGAPAEIAGVAVR